MSNLQIITKAFEKFKNHYANRLEIVETEPLDIKDIKTQFVIKSEKLRDRNYPTILFHGQKTRDVIVLTHGLSDSPFYVQAIGKSFYNEGLNVILPLLPAHGLKDPDKAMEDKELDKKWREEIDNAVEVAILLGDRVSLGGFSTGGALSLNKILRHPDKVKGGLFLFSGAIDLGLKEEASRIPFIQTITSITDGVIKGIGPNPYKYPELPQFAGLELIQIIQENEELLKNLETPGQKIANPVFCAHSVHDLTATIEGIIELLNNHVTKGIAFIISENVCHEEVVLAEDIKLDEYSQLEGPKANPQFAWMLDDVIRFFHQYVSDLAMAEKIMAEI